MSKKRNTIIFGLIFIFSTAFVLLPYASMSLASGPREGVHTLSESMLNMFSNVAQLPKVMLLDFHTFWWPYVDYEYPFGNLFFLLSFVFSAVLLVHALFDRNDWTMFALIALVLLFFFTKGNCPPFAEIYTFLNLLSRLKLICYINLSLF